jgi:anti-sigma factor RsiW
MNHETKPVNDQELHAYVDGELSERRRVEVEDWLAHHAQAAAQVDDYRRIREHLHARFDPLLSEAVDLPMAIAAPTGHSLALFARAAAIAVLVLCSAALGWTLKGWSGAETASLALADLVQPATFAHQVYSTDTRYPVEIPAVEQTSLNRWVSLRMHTELRAPELSGQGLKFIGGRLLPSTNRMAAQFMYEDAQGRRLTVYVRRIAGQDGFSGIQYREQDDLHIFYWMDRAMGYAVIGQQAASRLIAVANAVHLSMQETNGYQ